MRQIWSSRSRKVVCPRCQKATYVEHKMKCPQPGCREVLLPPVSPLEKYGAKKPN